MTVLDLAEAPAACPASAPADRGPLPALAAGDEATWQETVRRYEGLLRSAARVVLRSDADVDEAVQRTWVLLFRNADAHQRPAVPAGLAVDDRPPRGAGHPAGRSSAPIPSEDVADQVAPDDRDVATALMDAGAAPGAGPRRRDPARDASAGSCGPCCASRRPTTRSARSSASRGAASARCAGRAVQALRAQLEPSLRFA